MAVRASRSPRTGSPRARARGRSTRCCAPLDDLPALHAYRDAARAARHALELWPDGEREGERIVLARALRAQRGARRRPDRGRARVARGGRRRVAQRAPGARSADAQRRLASIYELRGDRERALAARRVAADSFAANGLPGEAAAERLVVAGYLQSAGKHGEAAALARVAREEAQRAERLDLHARALGLEGVATAKGGQFAAGVETVRAGLSLALGPWPHAAGRRALPAPRHGARDRGRLRRRARGAHHRGRPLPHRRRRRAGAGLPVCVAYVVRELGDWDAVRRAVPRASGRRRPSRRHAWWPTASSAPSTPSAVSPARARPLLLRALDTASRLNVVSMQLDTAAALA